jgi:hypothetical protein
MTQTSDTIEYRVATQNDAAGIASVVEEVAPEIPVSLDTPLSQARMKTEVLQCCNSGYSWVATKADGAVVGFALARPDAYGQQRARSLRYIGVSATQRKRGICGALMEKLKAEGVVILASVLHGNKSDMKNILPKFGFTEEGFDDKGTNLRWDPTIPRK